MNIKSVNSQPNFKGSLITKKGVVVLEAIESHNRPYWTDYTHPDFDCFMFYNDPYTYEVELKLIKSLTKSNYLIANLPNAQTMDTLKEIGQIIIEKLK